MESSSNNNILNTAANSQMINNSDTALSPQSNTYNG